MRAEPPTPTADRRPADAGPDHDVALSSRVRLARNIAGYPFLSRATAPQWRDLMALCRSCIQQSDLGHAMNWVDLAAAPEVDRQLLVERRLISRQQGQGTFPRGAAISENESIAIMVNEEDHLRLQAIQPGTRLQAAYELADRVDDALERRLDYAFSPRLGYLAACPTNVGTGIRVSVMLHLPALVMTGEIEKLRRASKEMGLAVRGFHGEGTEAAGDLFQLSNQTTLGKSERQILDDFSHAIIPRVIEYERKARQAMIEERGDALEDRLWRAWGALGHARLLGGEEAMAMLSLVRLGVVMGRIETRGVTPALINELFVLTQPAHLQKLAGHPLDSPQRRGLRADFVRRKLGF